MKDKIQEAVGSDIMLGVHVNGDESMAFGASFIAANSSASFVVRDVFLHQTVPEDVSIKVTGPETEVERVIFAKGEDLGRIEKLAFNSTQDLHIEFSQNGKVFLEYDIEGIESHFDWKPEHKENSTTPLITLNV